MCRFAYRHVPYLLKRCCAGKDLNAITADTHDQGGPSKVKAFFSGDRSHTSKAGANVNARSVVEETVTC